MSSDLFTIALLIKYYKKTGKITFTYNDIRKFYYSQNDCPYEWHTIERVIRRLANSNIITRLKVRIGRRGVYKLDVDKLYRYAITLMKSKANVKYVGSRIVVEYMGKKYTVYSEEELEDLLRQLFDETYNL